MNAEYKGKQRLTGAEAMTWAIQLKRFVRCSLIFIGCHKTHPMTRFLKTVSEQTLCLCIGPVVK